MATSTRAASSSRGRNASPSASSSGLNLSRAQEKVELETLNNRLAVYIDTVRRLEQDNEKLKNVIASYTDTYESETSKVKLLYERELEDAKKLIEELAREKSRLEIDGEKARAEAQDVYAKLARREREIRAAEGRLKQYEGEIADLKARNDAIVLDANRKTDDNVTLRGLNADLEKQVAALKRQLESETLLRVDLENKNKTLREQLQFVQNVHETEIEQVRHQKHVERTQYVDDGLRAQYDDRLLQELHSLRQQTDAELQQMRDEIAGQYEKKIEDLQNSLRRNNEQMGNYRQDMIAYRERIEDVTKTRDALNEKVLFLEQRVRDLEDRLHRAQQKQDEALADREEELARLKLQIEQMQQEYQNLLDIKILLDREIATYRKLLESEEERLNISGTSASRIGDNSLILDGGAGSGGASTASNTTFEASNYQTRKRPRYDDDVTHLSSTTASGGGGGATNDLISSSRTYAVSSSSSATGLASGGGVGGGGGAVLQGQLLDGINIIEDDSAHPKFVKLINNSNQELTLNGWVLKRKVGAANYEFKFPKGMVLRPGATTTIWSSDVNDISVDPPTNLKLRTAKWFTTGTETKKTVLEDVDGRVVAERTTTIK